VPLRRDDEKLAQLAHGALEIFAGSARTSFASSGA
jgi:hypothetical protein